MASKLRANNWWLFGGFLGLVIIGAIAIVAHLYSNQDDSLLALKKNGVIRIGYSVEAPYAFLNARGAVTGESIEIAKIVIARLGIQRIEWRQVEFDELIPELQSGRIDVIAAGMFITPERAKSINFSEPTFHVRQGLLVAKGNPRQLHSYQQVLDHPGAKIAVLSGSIEEKMMPALGFSEAQWENVPDAWTGQVAVQTGLVDGLALSSPTIQWMVTHEKLDGVDAAIPFEQSLIWNQERLGYGGFAFRKGDLQLLQAWNAILKPYIGSSEHLKLIEQYGFSQAELPGKISTQEIIVP